MCVYLPFHSSDSTESPTFFPPTPDSPPYKQHSFFETIEKFEPQNTFNESFEKPKPQHAYIEHIEKPKAQHAIIETVEKTKPLPPIPTTAARKHSHEEHAVSKADELVPPVSPRMRHRTHTHTNAEEESVEQAAHKDEEEEDEGSEVDPPLSPILRHRAYTDIMLEVNMPSSKQSPAQSMDDASIQWSPSDSPSVKQRSFMFIPDSNQQERTFPFQSFIPHNIPDPPTKKPPKPIPINRHKFPETQVRLHIDPNNQNLSFEHITVEPQSQHRSAMPQNSPLLQHPLL